MIHLHGDPVLATPKHRWPFGKIDGPGKWNQPQLNQGPLFFKQTNQKDTYAPKNLKSYHVEWGKQDSSGYSPESMDTNAQTTGQPPMGPRLQTKSLDVYKKAGSCAAQCPCKMDRALPCPSNVQTSKSHTIKDLGACTAPSTLQSERTTRLQREAVEQTSFDKVPQGGATRSTNKCFGPCDHDMQAIAPRLLAILSDWYFATYIQNMSEHILCGGYLLDLSLQSQPKKAR